MPRFTFTLSEGGSGPLRVARLYVLGWHTTYMYRAYHRPPVSDMTCSSDSAATLTIDQTQKLYILQNCLKYLVGPIHSIYVSSKNSEEEKCVFLKFYFWKAGPQASDRRTIKGRTVFKIKVVFAAAADQAISNKTSAVEKWLDKIKQWTPIVVQ